MDSDRTKLARRILEDLAKDHSVSIHDAIQLRKWAVRPEDSTLSLVQIAWGILDEEENRNADAADNS